MSEVKSDLLYTQDHEWARIEGDVATIGITDHAQSSLGDIVYVDLPQVGRSLTLKETFGVVESIKAVSDLYSPCVGTVIEVNSPLTAEPSLLNQDPYQKAWLVKIRLTDPAGARAQLLKAEDYSKLLGTL